jgi:hypothetical protein
MRLFSWYGLAAVMTAACCGYLAGVGHRPCAGIAPLPPIPSHEEEATPPPAPPPGFAARSATNDGVPAEEIDLTCPPLAPIPFDAFLQTVEPPIAQPGIRQVTFEFPAEGPNLPPVMPYLDDEPADSGPGCPEAPRHVEFCPIHSYPNVYTLPSGLSMTDIAIGLGLWTYTPPR